ncbi:uromodulin-like [Stylophora pistillata]|uniref:Uromodulin n=1 Tax=Stylophora pistillata TaxID=50429 RepID=A0A2B4RGI5_STYPI|nr:uromodulin-like [Stylophora pistillata]PFX15590.1 Uromodulin [Stylophora pistillata]
MLRRKRNKSDLHGREKVMASKEKQTISVDQDHSKRDSLEEQPSETRSRHVSAAINCLTRCRRKTLVTVVALIVAISVLIAVVLVGKHLTQTHDHNNVIDTEEVSKAGQDIDEDEDDCNNTNGSHNRTCKGEYVRPFQPCKDVNASFAKSNASLNCTVDPCVNYKVLSNADRRSSHITVFNQMSCDVGFWGWYRFVGAAGTRMPDRCIRRNRCNTVLSGWLNDDHPSVEDGEISRTVCFSQHPYGCCRFILEISVINCGSYYVYRFVTPPKCPGRYCSTD